MNWKCWFFHKWGKWGQRFCFGYNDFERRACERCGKTVEREIGWAIDD